MLAKEGRVDSAVEVCIMDVDTLSEVGIVLETEVSEVFVDTRLGVAIGGRTIVVGALISMIEYSVAVIVTGVAAGVSVMSTNCVVFGPSTVCVDMMTSVVGGKVSVSKIVCVVGG